MSTWSYDFCFNTEIKGERVHTEMAKIIGQDLDGNQGPKTHSLTSTFLPNATGQIFQSGIN